MPESPVALAGPAWESISHDVLCPLCGYNLRGLTDPRCPECGYRFEWAVVTDPTARLHPYLFEHHPERNVRSFFRTQWGTLRPIRFWSSLSPTQPYQPWRLVIYGFFSSLLTLLPLITEWTSAAINLPVYSPGSSTFRFRGPHPNPPTIPAHNAWWDVALNAWRYDGRLRLIAFYTVVWLVWPWFTLLALSVFRVSMDKAKVKTIHVMRCLVYTFDLGAWLGLIFGTAALLSIWFPSMALDPRSGMVPLLVALIMLIVFLRLWMAYRLYLRFDHSFWTILASQVIVFLLVLNFFLDLERVFFNGA